MSEVIPILLRITGAGLILLAILHVPIGRKLMWREQAARMSPENEAIFHVHAFFICVLLVMMGLPSLLEPSLFLEKSRAAAWASWLICGFWSLRHRGGRAPSGNRGFSTVVSSAAAGARDDRRT